MTLSTRLTQRFDIAHPIISAPMAFAAGGRLAAAVTSAGGLGLIGGGYGDAAWLDSERGAAGNAPVGYGFITWSLRTRPALLDQVSPIGRVPSSCRSEIRNPSSRRSRRRASR
jgi:nitronate monooxygenase